MYFPVIFLSPKQKEIHPYFIHCDQEFPSRLPSSMFHVKHVILTKYLKRKSLIRMKVTKAIMNLFTISLMILCTSITGELYSQKDREFSDPFNQLYEVLPTPNTYRTASGAPG